MLNENGITDDLQDQINGLGMNITDELIELGYVPDCTDTDDESEFEVQDTITEHVIEFIKKNLGLIKELETATK